MRFLYINLLILFSLQLTAQVWKSSDEGSIVEIEQAVISANMSFSDLTISDGSNNVATVFQKGIHHAETLISGDLNGLELAQSGRGNMSSIMILGDNNDTYLMMNGYDNIANFQQRGTNNEIDVSIIGGDRNSTNVIQLGRDLKLTQNIYGINDQQFGIEMTGNGMEILIETRN
jgi:hypothetical protein